MGDLESIATAISFVGDDDPALMYRGYAIDDLARSADYESVAHLLLRGDLPDAGQLAAYRGRLVGLRSIPGPIADLLDRIPDNGDPLAAMDVLRTAVSLLGLIEPEGDPARWLDHADRLIAIAPGLVVSWWRRVTEGIRIDPETAESTTAGHILCLLRGSPANEVDRRCLDLSLLLYAELAINASTLAARVCAATGSDFASCITAGLATLRGPLHGGASVAVAELLDGYATAEEAGRGAADRLARREKVAGFGHAIFRRRDPRSAILHDQARVLAGRDEGSGLARLLGVAEAIEGEVAVRKKLCTNVDFYTACCYRGLGIPLALFSPLFAVARLAGWSAHIAEQRATGRLIHPVAAYQGLSRRSLPG